MGERWPQHPQLARLASGPLDWAGHWPLATGLASWGHETVTAGTLRGWRGLDTATGTQASLTRHNSPLTSQAFSPRSGWPGGWVAGWLGGWVAR